jgi:hypothetical protein
MVINFLIFKFKKKDKKKEYKINNINFIKDWMY